MNVVPVIDPRFAALSSKTQALITRRFDGDIDIALNRAEHEVHTQRWPEPWTRELAAPMSGWKDPISWHV